MKTKKQDSLNAVYRLAHRLNILRHIVAYIPSLKARGFTLLYRKAAIQQDDKLDVMVWMDFQDKRRSKVMGFGQCKTGTTFDDQATIELQPDDFCAKWFLDVPVVSPIKMFFCSQYYPLDDYSKVKNAGLVFDRMRIMDCLPVQINEELYKQIVSWCSGAWHFLEQHNFG